MEQRRPTHVEAMQIPGRPTGTGYIVFCCHNHGLEYAVATESYEIEPHRLELTREIRWCSACAWCGVNVTTPEPGICMRHRPGPCPPWRRSEAWIFGQIIERIAELCPGRHVPEDMWARAGEHVRASLWECVESGADQVAAEVYRWSTEGEDEDPF